MSKQVGNIKPPCEYCIEVRLLGCAGMCKGFHAYASKLKKSKQSRLEHIKWTKKSLGIYMHMIIEGRKEIRNAKECVS